MSVLTVRIEGLEDHIERVVEEKLSARVEHEPERWLTSDEAAEYLGVAVSTIHDLTSRGTLPRHGAKGMKLRFKKADLDAYAEGRA